MPARPLARLVIVLLAAGALAFAALYGPSRRVAVTPSRVVSVGSVAEASALWHTLGLRGRVGIVLAGDLVPAQFGTTEADRGASGPEIDALTGAMGHGILREVRHVIPDARWPAMSRSVAHVTIYWTTDTGYVGAFEDGRVHVLPASRLARNDEPALVVLEARDWSERELQEIARRIRRGDLRTDLVAVVSATPSQVALLDAALTLR
jgi:hypothetical protein